MDYKGSKVVEGLGHLCITNSDSYNEAVDSYEKKVARMPQRMAIIETYQEAAAKLPLSIRDLALQDAFDVVGILPPARSSQPAAPSVETNPTEVFMTNVETVKLKNTQPDARPVSRSTNSDSTEPSKVKWLMETAGVRKRTVAKWIFWGILAGIAMSLVFQGVIYSSTGVKWTPFTWFWMIPLVLAIFVLFSYGIAVHRRNKVEKEEAEKDKEDSSYAQQTTQGGHA